MKLKKDPDTASAMPGPLCHCDGAIVYLAVIVIV